MAAVAEAADLQDYKTFYFTSLVSLLGDDKQRNEIDPSMTKRTVIPHSQKPNPRVSSFPNSIISFKLYSEAAVGHSETSVLNPCIIQCMTL